MRPVPSVSTSGDQGPSGEPSAAGDSSEYTPWPGCKDFNKLTDSHSSLFLGLHALIFSIPSLLQSFIFLLLPLWRFLIGLL